MVLQVFTLENAALGLISLLIMIVGYFLVEQFSNTKKQNEQTRNKQDDQMEKISTMIYMLKETVYNLAKIVEVIKQQQEDRDPRTERRLNEHSNKIKELDKRLTETEFSCKYKHEKQ